MTSKFPVQHVSCLAFIQGGRLLLLKRPPGKPLAGLWELPGGKIEAGETPEQALVREIHEELCITITPKDLTPLQFVSHAYPTFHVVLCVYTCTQWDGSMNPIEHTLQGKIPTPEVMHWVRPDDFGKYEMPGAIYPILPLLKKCVTKVS